MGRSGGCSDLISGLSTRLQKQWAVVPSRQTDPLPGAEAGETHADRRLVLYKGSKATQWEQGQAPFLIDGAGETGYVNKNKRTEIHTSRLDSPWTGSPGHTAL